MTLESRIRMGRSDSEGPPQATLVDLGALPGLAAADLHTGLRAPCRMQLVSSSAEGLLFRGLTRPLAPLLLAPLLLVLASLPWLGPTPMDVLRGLASAACLALASAAAITSWPRKRLLRLVAQPRVLIAGNEPTPLSGNLRWQLRAEREADAPYTVYSALLVLEDGRAWAVLRHPDPELVLRQFREVLAHWSHPVECGWGLPAGVRPWLFEGQGNVGAPAPVAFDAALPSRMLVCAPLARRDLSWSLAVMTLLVLIDLGFLVLSAGAALPQIHALSMLLPALFGGGLLALTLGVATGHARLVIAADILTETCVLGVRWLRGGVRLAAVRGVYVIGSDEAERCHLLLDSREGPLALPVPRGRAKDLARQTQLAIDRFKTCS
jgi:hypothetical protein